MSKTNDETIRELLVRWHEKSTGDGDLPCTTVRVGLSGGHEDGQKQVHDRDDSSYRHMNGDLSADSHYTPKAEGRGEEEEDDLKLTIDGLDESFASRDEQQPSSSSAVGSVQVDPQLEARVYARIKELRSNGLWSETRLPMCRDPGSAQRKKSHWDFLLEEVVWMHRDFHQERRLKRLAARKLAGEARRRYRQRQEESEEDKRKAAEREGKRLAGQIAAKIKEFWRNVDTVVDLRAREILDSHRQKAREQQLALLVDDVGKLGTLLHDDLENTTDDELPMTSELSSSEMDSKEVRRQRMNKIAEEAMGFQPKGFTLDTTQVRTPVPFLLRGTLREYQHVALDWLVTLYDKNLNGILADEMGLGKTIMAIALLAYLACERNVWGPHLIIVPTTVILNWEMELKRWCPGLKILTYFGSIKERREKRKGWSKDGAFHVCITSYKIFVQDAVILKRRKWQYLVLDEAQNIKNFKSQRWQALLMVRSRRRLLLTGTPLQNNLMELWSLLHFLMPTVFASDEDFRDWFSNPLTSMVEGNIEVNRPLVERLHKVLRPFILRRLKHDVEKQLPTKQEVIVPCPLSKRQRYLYSEFLSRRSTKQNLQSGNMFSVLNIIMQLRKCCNHPNLFEARQVSSPFIHPSIDLHLPAAVLPTTNIDAQCPQLFIRLTGSELEWSLFKSAGPVANWKSATSTPPSVALEGFRLSVDRNFTTTSAYSTSGQSSKMPLRNSGKRSLPAKDESPSTQADGVNGCDAAQPPDAKRAKAEICAEPKPSKTDEQQRRMQMRSAERRRTAMDLAQLHLLKGPPSLPLELVSAVGFEVAGGRVWCPAVEGPKSSTSLDRLRTMILSNVNIWAEDVIRSFIVHVEKVLLYSAPVAGLSVGAYAKYESERMEGVLAAIGGKMVASAYKANLGRLLQFPETRLIEYDCGKLQVLSNLLAQLYENKHRCLIFTQMTKMLDILQAFLAHHHYRYFRLDGSTAVEQRQAMMDRFNADSSVFVFILSTRAGGVGINLTGADTVIFYDSDWNPTMDAQAQDRCHRIGQTRNVTIYRLISEKTIEENILKKAMQKRRLGEMAIDEATFTPDFFRKAENIRELFNGEDGSAAIVEELATTSTAPLAQSEEDVGRVMTKVEDEMDVVAVRRAEAEVIKATEEEFDERIAPPAPSLFVQRDGDSPADQYAELISSMKPIERYALKMLEEKYRPNLEEQRREAEALMAAKRQQHLQLNAMESDDGGDERADVEMKEEFTYDVQKLWIPFPSPPNSECEFDLRAESEAEQGFPLYEDDLMLEEKLPPITIAATIGYQRLGGTKAGRDGTKRTSTSSSSKPKAKKPKRSDEFKVEPGSANGFKRPGEHLAHPLSHQQPIAKRPIYRHMPDGKSKFNGVGLNRHREVQNYEGPAWSANEDYHLLTAVTKKHQLTPELLALENEGLWINWDFVASCVNTNTTHYRSPHQCFSRYKSIFFTQFDTRLDDPSKRSKQQLQIPPSHIYFDHHYRKAEVKQQWRRRISIVTSAVASRKASAYQRPLPPVARQQVNCLSGRLPPHHEMRFAELGLRYAQTSRPTDLLMGTPARTLHQSAGPSHSTQIVASRR